MSLDDVAKLILMFGFTLNAFLLRQQVVLFDFLLFDTFSHDGSELLFFATAVLGMRFGCSGLISRLAFEYIFGREMVSVRVGENVCLRDY